MPRFSTILFFAAASLALLAVPGPAVLYIVTRTVESGRRVGLASVLGVHVGTVVHVLAAAAGLSALLVSSATAFSVVKYAGAAYLVFLGVRRLLDSTDLEAPREAATTPRRAFGQGVVVNVLNPKTALFFLAFLPTFLDPARGPVFVQVLVLGVTFITLGLLSDSAYALAASLLTGRWRAISVGRRVSGLVYVGLGVVAALTPRTTHSRA